MYSLYVPYLHVGYCPYVVVFFGGSLSTHVTLIYGEDCFCPDISKRNDSTLRKLVRISQMLEKASLRRLGVFAELVYVYIFGHDVLFC